MLCIRHSGYYISLLVDDITSIGQLIGKGICGRMIVSVLWTNNISIRDQLRHWGNQKRLLMMLTSSVSWWCDHKRYNLLYLAVDYTFLYCCLNLFSRSFNRLDLLRLNLLSRLLLLWLLLKKNTIAKTKYMLYKIYRWKVNVQNDLILRSMRQKLKCECKKEQTSKTRRLYRNTAIKLGKQKKGDIFLTVDTKHCWEKLTDVWWLKYHFCQPH